MNSDHVKVPGTSRDRFSESVPSVPGTIQEQEPAKLKVAFIVSKFPCYDEAFILRELYALSRIMDISIFSLRRSRENIVHDEARELLSRTIYIPYLLSWRIFGAHFQMMAARPVAYFRALFGLIFGNLRSPEFLMKSLTFFPKAVYLAKWLRKKGVQHVHAYWATYPASVALAASEISGVPFSFTGHAHDIYLDTTHLKEKMRRASFISTCTASNKIYLSRIASDVPADKILVNHHGLNLDRFETPGKKRAKTFQILSVGTLHYYKGFNYFLDALKILKEKGLDFRATIVGGGPLEEDLKKHLHLLGLSGYVTMTGPLKQDQVLPHYKMADVLVLMAQPEWHWGIPNVIIEALAANTAVITTRFGSVEELITDRESGLLVDPKDATGLASALENLYQDDALRVRLAENGRKKVLAGFDLSKNIRVFSDTFRRTSLTPVEVSHVR